MHGGEVRAAATGEEWGGEVVPTVGTQRRRLRVANSDAHVRVVVVVVVIDGMKMKPCVVGRSENFDDVRAL